MTVRRWPDPLPTPSAPGFGLSPVDQSIRTNMEIGAQRVRRRTTARFDRVMMDWIFNPYEMDAFRRWHESLPYSIIGASDVLSGWTFSGNNATRGIGGAIGPGSLVVDSALETAATGLHRIEIAGPAIDGADVLFMATVKGIGRTLGRLSILDRNGVQRYTEFDLSSGTLVAQDGLLSRAITSRGDGWWRVAITADIGSGVSTSQLSVRFRDDAGNLSYAGDITKGFGICEVAARIATGSDLFIPTDSAGNALGADGGSAWFYVPLAEGSALVSKEARFVGPYKATAKAGLNWSVSAEVEVRNA